MHRQPCRFFSNPFSVMLFSLLCCIKPDIPEDFEFSFNVLDVGQGLSLLGLYDKSSAIVWDMGPSQNYSSWFSEYNRLGKPLIHAIIISHRDLDHSGGLLFIDSSVNWTGTIITSSFEDTSYLKKLCEKWDDKISILTIAEGDSLWVSKDLNINCLWPPVKSNIQLPTSGDEINRYSLVFTISHENCRFLIPSDIDSIAAEQIALKYKNVLLSDILILPHHGSISAFNFLFAGYVHPKLAIVSCARYNDYNHPSLSILSLYSLLGADIRTTYTDGTICIKSNSFVWQYNR